MFRTALCVIALGVAATSYGAEPILDNERVTVWDTTSPLPPAQHDFVAVSLSHLGTATLGRKGEVAGKIGTRTVVIELKEHPLPSIANTSGYPLAFPRPNARSCSRTIESWSGTTSGICASPHPCIFTTRMLWWSTRPQALCNPHPRMTSKSSAAINLVKSGLALAITLTLKC